MSGTNWKSFWDNFPGWLKASIMVACGAGGMFGITGTHTGSEPEPWSIADVRKVVRDENRPLRAALEALAESQPDRVKVAMLQAMMKADRKIQENESKEE